MMTDFIEIFHSSAPQTPYFAIVWRSYTVTGIAQCADMADVAAYCNYHALPVVCKRQSISEQLFAHGIIAQPFTTRIIRSYQEHGDDQALAMPVLEESPLVRYVNGG